MTSKTEAKHFYYGRFVTEKGVEGGYEVLATSDNITREEADLLLDVVYIGIPNASAFANLSDNIIFSTYKDQAIVASVFESPLEYRGKSPIYLCCVLPVRFLNYIDIQLFNSWILEQYKADQKIVTFPIAKFTNNLKTVVLPPNNPIDRIGAAEYIKNDIISEYHHVAQILSTLLSGKNILVITSSNQSIDEKIKLLHSLMWMIPNYYQISISFATSVFEITDRFRVIFGATNLVNQTNKSIHYLSDFKNAKIVSRLPVNYYALLVELWLNQLTPQEIALEIDGLTKFLEVNSHYQVSDDPNVSLNVLSARYILQLQNFPPKLLVARVELIGLVLKYQGTLSRQEIYQYSLELLEYTLTEKEIPAAIILILNEKYNEKELNRFFSLVNKANGKNLSDLLLYLLEKTIEQDEQRHTLLDIFSTRIDIVAETLLKNPDPMSNFLSWAIRIKERKYLPKLLERFASVKTGKEKLAEILVTPIKNSEDDALNARYILQLGTFPPKLSVARVELIGLVLKHQDSLSRREIYQYSLELLEYTLTEKEIPAAIILILNEKYNEKELNRFFSLVNKANGKNLSDLLLYLLEKTIEQDEQRHTLLDIFSTRIDIVAETLLKNPDPMSNFLSWAIRIKERKYLPKLLERFASAKTGKEDLGEHLGTLIKDSEDAEKIYEVVRSLVLAPTTRKELYFSLLQAINFGISNFVSDLASLYLGGEITLAPNEKMILLQMELPIVQRNRLLADILDELVMSDYTRYKGYELIQILIAYNMCASSESVFGNVSAEFIAFQVGATRQLLSQIQNVEESGNKDFQFLLELDIETREILYKDLVAIRDILEDQQKGWLQKELRIVQNLTILIDVMGKQYLGIQDT